MSVAISVTEWMAELDSLSRYVDNGEFLTTEELAAAAGVKVRKMAALLKQGLKAGLVSRGTVPREILTGNVRMVSAYRVNCGKKKRK